MAADEWPRALSAKQHGQVKVWEDSCLVSEGFVVVDNSVIKLLNFFSYSYSYS